MAVHLHPKKRTSFMKKDAINSTKDSYTQTITNPHEERKGDIHAANLSESHEIQEHNNQYQ